LAGGGAAGNAAIPAGSLPGDDLAGAGPEQFAAPVAFSAIFAFSYSAITPWTWVSSTDCGSSAANPRESVNATTTPKRSSSSSTSTW
jgi:hypothetical protein